jgi:hypothetical protein
MNENKGLLSAGFSVILRTKRYVVWFFILNLVLASMGAAVLRINAGNVTNNSLASERLVNGMDMMVLGEMLNRPEVGHMQTYAAAASDFMILFVLASIFLMPGVFLGYASHHRLPRTEYLRACGHNFWRFVRLFIMNLIITGIPVGILFAIMGGLSKAADKSTNELLPFYIQMICLGIIFLVMTFFRAWFDQAETETVLRDENAVRRTIGPARRRTTMGLWATYVVISIIGAIFFAIGMMLWHSIVPPSSVTGAIIIGQLTLLMWMTARFWQRACAVVFYERSTEPVIETRPLPVMPMNAVQV